MIRRHGYNTYEIRWNWGHYDVYCNGSFCVSADTYEEALTEIDEMEEM